MPIEIKKFTIGDKKYKIKHHPATEGCLLIERYATAIRAFAIDQETRFVHNNQLLPFAVVLNGQWLALLMFLDRVAAPEADYIQYVPGSKNSRAGKLALTELLAGTTVEDRVGETIGVPTPLSYAIDFRATSKQEEALDIESILGLFFKYITFEDEPLELDAMTYGEIAACLSMFIEHNVLPIWTKTRWTLPANYNSGGISAPASLARVATTYSQSNIVYSVMNSSLNLASATDLATLLSAPDACDLNELATRKYFEDCESRKESERQAKTNH